MPTVKEEIEETLSAIQELPTYQAPLAEPQRPGFTSRVTAGLKDMVACRKQRAHEAIASHDKLEMAYENLLREHPDMYIKATAG